MSTSLGTALLSICALVDQRHRKGQPVPMKDWNWADILAKANWSKQVQRLAEEHATIKVVWEDPLQISVDVDGNPFAVLHIAGNLPWVSMDFASGNSEYQPLEQTFDHLLHALGWELRMKYQPAESCSPGDAVLLATGDREWTCPSCGRVWPTDKARDGYGCEDVNCSH